ncbi:MAG TPA: AraC family transcriptional regulator [Cyanobacteria bacterium UBA11149]|nr:AraC family transcriptional regulator [Cyanobacteria bacterium UBA11367]HBE56675.1 AraC family transcriptional regulator [Cyanobacteria bacterium UBA11366]HBK66375.1 AraC family transcriptional regulator [Cyanobacteria bacterium UBA11166]HBR74141.1 AraC family transcriptional regulator [Cyanobacteria bacterium UBA11159]HBS72163.1 AraC family transcriptional regulator [Cyanobacteria bacterium UBA11153]HBW87846.1 AraC family transcriptional regulator [Cyanobacteria bacterium UBA11149]HCA9367
MTTLLPQNDPNPQRRQQFLQRQRYFYRYNFTYLPPLPFPDEVPDSEGFSAKYYGEQFKGITKLGLNLGAAKLDDLLDPFDNLDDYEKLFLGEPLLRKPFTSKTFLLDKEFAHQRIAGANPLIIERVDPAKLRDMLQKFPVTDAILQQVVDTEETLASAAAKGQLYLTDYALLEGMKLGSYKHWQKFVTAPLALFYWQSTGFADRGCLVPVAIQLYQKPRSDNPIFTRFDGANWFIAKTFVQIADGTYHELLAHLGFTHLVIVPFILATARQLADNHPLGILLRPHFQFTLAINDLARTQLINPGGFIEKILPGTLKASLSLVGKSIEESQFQDFALPNQLKRRGVEDSNLLPDYPYRDDAYLLWSAIEKFVTSYVNLYYKNDGDVVKDYELQEWVEELTSPDGGRVKGLTDDGKIDNLEKLIAAIVQIIFICGPQHAAVNYPQYDYGAFAPNIPAAGYAAPPTQKDNPDFHLDLSNPIKSLSPYLLKFLPPKEQAISQLTILYLLTSFQYNRLGYYDRRDFQDAKVQPLITAFQQNLHIIEDRINLRNTKRSQPYTFLKPSLIPNSINL